MRFRRSAIGREPRDAGLSAPVLEILRGRIASGFYDRPELVDALARALFDKRVAAPS